MNARRQAGFTLLEVIIGATLLSIMMLLLTGSLRISAESWDAGEERMAKASRMFVVLNFLRGHMGGLLPVAGTRKDGEIDFAFKGGPDSLEYVAALPEQVKAGGLYRFRLYVSNAGGHKDLRVAIIPHKVGGEQDSKAEPLDDLPLVEKVEEVKLSYLPLVVQNNNPLGERIAVKWNFEWQEPQLPALVRLEITPENEDPWPALVIAPKIQMLR